jgi:hypothetical protein
MIDTRRWVLCEAWLSLGLRIEWAGYASVPREDWMEDDGVSYYYDGYGTWKVAKPTSEGYRTPGLPPLTAPMLPTESMRHELAHWLSASQDQRLLRNFGITQADPENRETRALDAEATIDAMMGACDRILSQAIAGRRR